MAWTFNDVPSTTRVFVDGEEVQKVISVWPFENLVERYMTDADGRLIFESPQSFKTEVLIGKITMEFPNNRDELNAH